MRKPSISLIPAVLRLALILLGFALPSAALAQSSITLVWNANPEADLAGYRVHYGTRSGALTEVITVGTAPSARVSGLLPSTTYHFAVRAVNLAGKTSNLSRELTFRTADPPSPEIDVTGPGGSTLVSQGDGISFRIVKMPGASAAAVIRLKNSGSAPLTDLGISILGDHATDFRAVTDPPSALAAGGEATIEVRFQPAAEGTRSARLVIASNDADENPFIIPLSGTGVAPDPVTLPAFQLSSADGSPLPDGPLDFGDLLLNAPARKIELRLRNTGDTVLTGIAASIQGGLGTEFSLGQATVPNALAPGAEALFGITFQPLSIGRRTAALRIVPGIPGRDPVEISLIGRGIAVPGIALQVPGGEPLAQGTSMPGFGTIELGKTSETRYLQVRSIGTADLTGITVSLVGSHAGDFQTDAPSAVLKPGGVSPIAIRFSPTAAGERVATLRVISNDPARSTYEIQLSGTGFVPDPVKHPAFQLSSADGSPLPDGPLDFGDLLLNAPARKIELRLRNTGDTVLTGIAASIQGGLGTEFSLGQATVPNALAPGAEALFGITFQPLSIGRRTAALRIVPGIPGRDPVEISLIGRGIGVPGIALQVPGGELLAQGAFMPGFGTIELGKTSETRYLQVRSIGTADLTGITVSLVGSHAGDFQTDAPSAVLKPGGVSPIGIRFSPTAAGERVATLRVISNDPARSPYEIQLSGTGDARPEIAVLDADDTELTTAISRITFDVKDVRSPAATRILRIRNRGTAPLTGLAASITGDAAADFQASLPPTLSLAPGASTEITLGFAPQTSGIRHAELRIASNDADENPFVIALSGNVGVSPRMVPVDAEGNPLPENPVISFGSAIVGKAAGDVVLTLRNTGDGELNRIVPALEGPQAADFVVRSHPATIAAGGSGQVLLGFKPGAAGPRGAVLRITSNDETGGPVALSLTGSGLPRPGFRIEREDGTAIAGGASPLSFGGVKAGSASSALTLVIRNTGATDLTGISAALTGSPAFTLAPPVPTVAAGAAARFTVTFAPSGGGLHQAQLRVTADGVGAGFESPLTGLGLTAPEIEVRDADAAALVSGEGVTDFGSRDLRLPALKRSFVIRNTGNAPLTGIRLITDGLGAAGFAVEGSAPRTLAPGISFPLVLAYRPPLAGTQEGTLRIASNDADENPFVVRLRGTGTAVPEARITIAPDGSPASADIPVDFGRIEPGGESAAVIYQIRNRGSAPLVIESIGITGSAARDFLISGAPRGAIAPGAIAGFSVRFAPKTGGLRQAGLRIRTNDPAGDLPLFPLTGFCVTRPKLELTFSNKPAPEVLRFGEVPVGDVGSPRTLTLRNSGDADLTDLRISVTGRDRADFPWSANAPARLAPGEELELRIDFKPGAAGGREAQLKIASNDTETGTRLLPLSGTGVSSPHIELRDGGGLVLEDDNAFMDLLTGKPRTIRIRNIGNAPLTGISASLRGPHAADFRIRETPAGSLAPGDSTTIRISFPADRVGIRWAVLRINSDDPQRPSVGIELTGRSATGSASSTSSATSHRGAHAAAAEVVRGVVSIDGTRYRCITLDNRAGLFRAADVEVSSNLVDWSSGERHTTVMRDKDGVLKVRDNTPIPAAGKRFIRLRPR